MISQFLSNLYVFFNLLKLKILSKKQTENKINILAKEYLVKVYIKHIFQSSTICVSFLMRLFICVLKSGRVYCDKVSYNKNTHQATYQTD